MGQISAASLQGAASNAPAGSTQPVPGAEERARNRSLAAAANTVNEAGLAGNGREVTLSFDQAARQPVIKVVDANTGQVIDQWPPEYLLQPAADITNSKRDSG